MNLINSVNYSDLKSQTNVIKIISELYNEDMSINFKEDFKEQLLSNIQRKLNNTLLVKVLFTIFVHELEIKENSSEFDDIKSSILAMLKKDQNIETFDCFIKHISCLYNKYDSILIGNIICKNNNIYEYINNFTDPSLIEDKILEEISLNLNTMQFYLDFFEFLNFEPGKFIHLFSNLDFYNENLLIDVINNKEIQKSLITAIFKLLLLKIECLPNYSANKDIKFNDRYLEYFLSEYINNNVYFSSLYFDSGDLKKIHYFKSSFLSSFIENQISIIYQDPNIHFLLNVHNFNKDIKKGFFMKFNKIKEIIKFSENRDFHKSIFNFLFNNFPIKYSMLFINPCVNDFISSDFLEEIRYNNHNISDVKIKDSDISSIIFKNESKKIIDFLVSGNMKKKIEQYCTYQEYPFNYCFFISDFILIYKNQSHYINTNIEDEGTIVFNPSNQIVDDMNNACSYSEVKENNENINEMSEKINNKGEKNYVKEVEPKENVVSDEPLYEIFSAESEIEIQSYADDLGDEGKGVKNQLRRIRKTGNKRYLQSSSKFFEKVDKLRDNFPNFEEFITSIEDYSILNQLGDNHFYIPPSLLVGDPGIGKTFFLSELSDTIGIENKMIHMETMSASWLLVGASSQWKDAKPGIVYDNIIKSKYANNIFILDELDKMMKSNYPVDNCLLQLFEKHTAKEFKDEYIPLKLDISKIIWLATANTLSTISDPILSRLQTYKIANPNFNERKKLAQNIYNHMLAENTWGSHFNPIIPDATLDKLCEPSDSIREMKKVLLKAITHSARRNDNVITIEDIISVNTTSKNKIGFM